MFTTVPFNESVGIIWPAISDRCLYDVGYCIGLEDGEVGQMESISGSGEKTIFYFVKRDVPGGFCADFIHEDVWSKNALNTSFHGICYIFLGVGKQHLAQWVEFPTGA